MQMTAYEWYRLQPKAEHLQTEVKFREIKVQCKIKDEQFKGENFTRYYAQKCDFVMDVAQENANLVGKLIEIAGAS